MIPPVSPSDSAVDRPKAAVRRSLAQRLISLRGALLLFRNTVASSIAFVLGIILLWVMVQQFGLNVYLATAVSFLVANAAHYALGRSWIFAGTARPLVSGYLYFVLNALGGLAATMALFALFTELVGMNYLVARVVASLFVGLAMFVSNAVLNFRSL